MLFNLILKSIEIENLYVGWLLYSQRSNCCMISDVRITNSLGINSCGRNYLFILNFRWIIVLLWSILYYFLLMIIFGIDNLMGLFSWYHKRWNYVLFFFLVFICIFQRYLLRIFFLRIEIFSWCRLSQKWVLVMPIGFSESTIFTFILLKFHLVTTNQPPIHAHKLQIIYK